MAKATKKAAVKKSAAKKSGTVRRNGSSSGRSSGKGTVPNKKDAPVCTIEKDQSEYAQ